MAALKIRRVRPRPRRTLSAEVAPTAIAPSGPSSTTAARVAAELGDQMDCREVDDHADCREVNVVGAESQTRNSSASTTRVTPDLLAALSASASLPSTWISASTAAAATTPTYSRAVGESRDRSSLFGRCPLPVIMPVGSPPGATTATAPPVTRLPALRHPRERPRTHRVAASVTSTWRAPRALTTGEAHAG